jgi:hypothetical protein
MRENGIKRWDRTEAEVCRKVQRVSAGLSNFRLAPGTRQHRDKQYGIPFEIWRLKEENEEKRLEV